MTDTSTQFEDFIKSSLMEKCLETCGDDGDGASVQSGDCGDGAGVHSGDDGDGDGASVESCDSLYSHPHVAAVPYD